MGTTSIVITYFLYEAKLIFIFIVFTQLQWIELN